MDESDFVGILRLVSNLGEMWPTKVSLEAPIVRFTFNSKNSNRNILVNQVLLNTFLELHSTRSGRIINEEDDVRVSSLL